MESLRSYLEEPSQAPSGGIRVSADHFPPAPLQMVLQRNISMLRRNIILFSMRLWPLIASAMPSDRRLRHHGVHEPNSEKRRRRR
jgi:hypothetical protein